MTEQSYREILKRAEQELVDLFREREALERKVARQRQTVITLRIKVEGDRHPRENVRTWVPKNLTDACRLALMASNKPLDAPDLRDRVEALGFDIGSSNPLASIHSVVKRLIEQGEAKRAYQRGPDGKLLWYTLSFWYVWESDEDDAPDLPRGWFLPTEAQIQQEYKQRVRRLDKNLAVARRRKARKT